MMRFRPSTVRRRRSQSASSALKDKDSNHVKQDSTPVKKKSVQWADNFNGEHFCKPPLRKYNSDGILEFDKALEKLTRVSSMLETSTTLETDFDDNLKIIQKKLLTDIDLNETDEKTAVKPFRD